MNSHEREVERVLNIVKKLPPKEWPTWLQHNGIDPTIRDSVLAICPSGSAPDASLHIDLSDLRPSSSSGSAPDWDVTYKIGELYKQGDVIGGKYEIRKEIGRGGFGIVYLVHSRETNETLALKTLREELISNPACLEIVKREVRLWLALNRHPHVVDLRAAEIYSGRLFVVMDYIAPDSRGRTSLADWLKVSELALPVPQLLAWSIAICHAVEHANAHGIVAHQDIKPANILIDSDAVVYDTAGAKSARALDLLGWGIARLSDFGLASGIATSNVGLSPHVSFAATSPGLTVLKTARGTICGTPGYIAPEIYEGKKASVLSDIFSFGAVLWQCVRASTTSPFHSEAMQCDPDFTNGYQQQVYARECAMDYRRVQGSLGEVIDRCLSYDQSRRYSSFHALRVDLESRLLHLPGKRLSIPVFTETADFWNNKGASFAALGQFDDAVRCFSKAIDTSGDGRQASHLVNKGRSLVTLGRYEEALLCHDQALSLEPELSIAWEGKAQALGYVGQLSEAISCHKKAVQFDPKYVDGWDSLGLALRQSGKYDEAIKCYDEALKISPKEAPVIRNRADALQAAGRSQEALESFDLAIRIDPNNADYGNNKGGSLVSLERFAEALRCYDRALDLNPEMASAWQNKGICCSVLKDDAEAVKCFEAAVKLDPSLASCWKLLGDLYIADGRVKDAVQCFRSALSAAPLRVEKELGRNGQ